MNEGNNKPLKPKPQLKNDIEALGRLLNDVFITHRYKYGYGYKIQKLVAEIIECYHGSQIYTDFNKRSEVLQDILVKLDSISSILEILSSSCGIYDDELNLIYRHMGKIAKQTNGLRKYFVQVANNQGITAPHIGK